MIKLVRRAGYMLAGRANSMFVSIHPASSTSYGN